MRARWVVGSLVAWTSLAHADPPPPSTAAVAQLAIVAGSTCALHADGKVSCWGRDLDRSLKGTLHARPIGVTAFGDGVVELEGVFGGICARYRDRTMKCLGMLSSSRAAAELQPLHDVVDVRGTCARTGDGHVACFDGRTWVAVPRIDDAIDAHGSDLTGCAIHKDTTVSCWGIEAATRPDTIGAAADGAARLIPGVEHAVQVAAGLFFACARLRDGRVTCWGDNSGGQLGRGKLDEAEVAFHPAAPVAGVTDAIDVMAGATHACIRRKAGPMLCWGFLPWDERKHPTATRIAPLATVTAFAAGDQQCMVGTGRDVWCMGPDRDGELGNGLSSILDGAVEIPGVHDAIQIYATTLGTCALHRTGAVTCWGKDHHEHVTLPAVRLISEVTRAFSGGHLTGLDGEGRLWIDGEATPRALPRGSALAGSWVIANGGEVWCNAIRVGGTTRGPVSGHLAGVTDAVEIAGNGSLLRRRTGEVSTFSIDSALGSYPPDRVATIDDAIAIAAGERVSCAVRADHTVWCFGDADSPLLGHAPAKPTFSRTQLAPARIAGITDAVAVAIFDAMPTESTGFICALELDGGVACWGENRHGQLGNQLGGTSQTPVKIRGVKDAVQVVAGWTHACALEKSGAVACWGSTEDGAGGTPPTERIDHPVAVQWP